MCFPTAKSLQTSCSLEAVSEVVLHLLAGQWFDFCGVHNWRDLCTLVTLLGALINAVAILVLEEVVGEHITQCIF